MSTNDNRTLRPYGSWESPITSEMVTATKIEFLGLFVDRDKVYWNELRYSEEERCVICSADRDGKIQQWTPPGFSARSMVHEYGGGDFFVANHEVYFTNFSDQALYKQTNPTTVPHAVVDTTKEYRYADGRFCPHKSIIYCVREDHEVVKTGAKEQENTIVSIDLKTTKQCILVSGADFYSCPRVSRDGTQIVWVQWSHPNMPWDSTEIWKATLSDDGTKLVEDSVKKVVGGKDEKGQNWSVMQPGWTSMGKLLFIGDQTNWWNLYELRDGKEVNLHRVSAEIGGPEWKLGKAPYAQEPGDGSRILTSFNGELGMLDRKTRRYVKLLTGFSSHSHLSWGDPNTVYCFAHSETEFEQLIRLHVGTVKVNAGCCCIGRKSSMTLKPDVINISRRSPTGSDYLSPPQAVSWITTHNEQAYGWYYPPKNKDFVHLEDEQPPLLVRVHEGPTDAFSTCLDLELQYFTSRGFAVLCVDFRGSTRHGKSYRHRLRHMWGVLDVEDCCSGARYLVGKGLADPERLCIDGVGGGGFTTLACLIFYEVFTAGVSRSAVSDLTLVTQETHKFEKHYCDALLAPLGQGREEVSRTRSPINYVHKLQVPIAIFHGDADKVVPASQAKIMFEAAKEKGQPTAYVLFKGEEHRLRKPRNIQIALDGEFYFFGKVLGFEPAEKVIQMDIHNLKHPSPPDGIRRSVSSVHSFSKVRILPGNE